jgi:hypothetical protein
MGNDRAIALFCLFVCIAVLATIYFQPLAPLVVQPSTVTVIPDEEHVDAYVVIENVQCSFPYEEAWC